MRRANGEGSIFKLSGRRRKPWAVRITVGYTSDGKQQYKYLGYYSGKIEAKTALREYLVSPYDLNTKDVKLIEVFERWKKTVDLHETTLKTYYSAFNQAQPLHSMNMREIKAAQLELAMEPMRPHMRRAFKNIIRHLYKYAMKHEIVDKNISDLISVSSKGVEVKEKVPFSLEEIQKLKSYKHPLNDTAIILLYTGMRITELLEIKRENVFLDERYMIGGKKTAAGTDRIIPIHKEILPLIKARYDEGHKWLITRWGKKVQYPTYRLNYWNIMRDKLGLTQTPHDTRHTFATFADKCEMNKVAVKRILGHALRDVTDHYTHKDLETLITEIDKLKY